MLTSANEITETVFKAIQWIKNNSLLSPSVPSLPQRSCVSSLLLIGINVRSSNDLVHIFKCCGIVLSQKS